MQTNPFTYDIRQFLLLIYKAFTQVDLTYDCLLRKIEQESFFCSLSHRTRNVMAKEFLALSDKLFIEDIGLDEFITQAIEIIA